MRLWRGSGDLLHPGTTLLAWRNLSHERTRFIATLVGIAFSVVLMGAQLGLLIGFAQTASTLVEHADADLWVLPLGTSNSDIAGRIPIRRRYEALAVPGVASVDEYMVQFAFWRKPDGGSESVIVTGYSLASGRGGPWAMVEGTRADLQIDDGVIIDRLYQDKLGVHGLGQVVEINNQRVRVVGFTDGIRTFTQSPYIFTTHARAQRLARFSPEETTYLLVKLAKGADIDVVRRDLAARLPWVEVLPSGEFARRTQSYWLITTGAGAALLLAAALGLLVGTVIVGQTLYASTLDRLAEYATLRAMGADRSYLNRVIVKQAALSAVIGYAIGLAVTLAMVAYTRTGNVAMALPPWSLLLLAVLTLLMCLAGALISIRRITRLDPTLVFQ
ncbi:ABC transporter permease [Dokdonella sp.]|uniref:ABC transporter permease n=1 Tax=Dokdonella sp. TaxID=2291710 RepID=UPI0031CA8A29|nr:ABC transporter permease [Dokdonella sp.]